MSPASLHLLACGSNSHGQLGLGHRTDVHRFERAHTWHGSASLVGFAAGGRHSLFLVEHDQRRTLFSCGDRAHHQLPPLLDGIDGYSPDPACATTVTEVDYRTLLTGLQNVGDELKDSLLMDYEPSQVACCWETSFVVLRSRTEAGPDHIVAFGSDDFDLRGSVHGLRDLSRPNVVEWPDPVHTGSARRVVSLVGGPQHLIAVVQYTGPGQQEFGELVGWGAARHGQLGPLVQNGLKLPRSIKPTRLSVPFPPPRDPTLIKIALGKEHTVVVYPTHIWCWGSNRRGQNGSELALLHAKQVAELQSCWHTTFVLTKAPANSSPRLFGFGSNTQGQLGVAGNSLMQAEHPVGLSSRDLCTGSEHVLMADGAHQVWGWGWNEHGNLGETEGKLQLSRPFELIFTTPENQIVTNIAAGCATSFIICQDKLSDET